MPEEVNNCYKYDIRGQIPGGGLACYQHFKYGLKYTFMQAEHRVFKVYDNEYNQS